MTVQIIESPIAQTDAAEWRALLGQCPARAAAPGAVSVSVPALGYLVCVSEG